MRFVFDFADAHGVPLRRVFAAPREILVARAPREVPPLLARASEAAGRGLYAAGFVSYEAAPAFDAAARVCPAGPLPLAVFALFEGWTPATADPRPGHFEVGPWQLDTSPDTYREHIGVIRHAIRQGDFYQVNYTLRARSRLQGDDFGYYEQLRRAQRAEFCAYLDLGRHRLLCASPELFFAWRDGRLTARPMKGTARRGYVPEEDAALARWLKDSDKNRAENLMIVDLLRNDLARLSVPGGVAVPSLFSIESYPTVLQMTSTVTARTRPGATLADVFAALFPCGSITGAPKLKSMETIAALEGTPRGAYCGAVGFVAPGGEAVFNVAIRTVTHDSETGELECGLGGGITWDSTAEDEYEEVLTKARFLSARAPDFDLLETLLLEDGRYWLRERHLARLAASAAHFGFAVPDRRLEDALAEMARAHPAGRHRVRLRYARDGFPQLESTALPAAPGEARPFFVLARAPVCRGDEFLRHKTTARGVYEAHLSPAPPQAFDVLLWNEEGELTEFTRGNLVLEIDGAKHTPPLACGLLDGTLRGELLERGEIREAVLTREDLARASRVWFINSVRGWVELCPAPIPTPA